MRKPSNRQSHLKSVPRHRETPAEHVPAPLPEASEAEKRDRHDAFVRLVQPRVQRILESLRILGNLSSSNYQYTQHEIDQIFKVLEDQFNAVHERFEKTERLRVKFTLMPPDQGDSE